MNTAVLPPVRPWLQRWVDRARTALPIRLLPARPTAFRWHEIDAWTLRDLGVDVSEIDSIDAEAACRAAPTRRRIVAGGPRD